MKKLLILALFLCAIPAWSQTTVNGRVQTGTNALKPATCSPGDQYNAIDLFQVLVCGPANTWVPIVSGAVGGSATQLQYNNGSFAGVTGSAVGASGQITLTPSTDGFSALVANPSSQNFGSVFPVINVNAGAGTVGCEALGGFAPAQMCINGATNQPWLYSLSITGDATNTASPTIALWDTSRTSPNPALGLLSVNSGTSVLPNGGLQVSYQGTNGLAGLMQINANQSIQFGTNSANTAYITFGTQPDVPDDIIVPNTGEIMAGFLADGVTLTSRTGFLSVIDGALGHKVSITNPGTLSANYNFAMPITAGTAGQMLTSQGGGTTPMLWKSTGVQCGTVAANGACANTLTSSEHCISGQATLSGGTSTITGISPAFTSSSSFTVVTNDNTTSTNASKGVPASASSITFTGTGTDTLNFIACGG